MLFLACKTDVSSAVPHRWGVSESRGAASASNAAGESTAYASMGGGPDGAANNSTAGKALAIGAQTSRDALANCALGLLLEMAFTLERDVGAAGVERSLPSMHQEASRSIRG
jgi:hypothetical protein